MSVTTTKGDTTNNRERGAQGSAMSEASAPARYDRAALWQHPDRFFRRHIGPDSQQIEQLLETCGFETLDGLIDTAVPPGIRLKHALNLPEPATESEALAELRSMASKNRVFRSFIGAGYSDCITPGVIQRNILENPGWYTQYTPYQAEIAQGRLEGLLNFQTVVTDLTGLEIANASMLDEPTAAAEAMTMCLGLKGKESKQKIFVASGCHPQTIEVVKTRAAPLGIEVEIGDPKAAELDSSIFAVLLQYPDTQGGVTDYSAFVEKVHANDALVIVATDLLALTLLTSPGEWGADVAVGNSQRFGVPLGFGGPHAAFFATRDAFKRRLPGRLVGVSKDAAGRPALRLALQTREQHIRRDRATSNICTAQVLLAIIASMYAVYHGPSGLKAIATRVLYFTRILASGLRRLGYELETEPAFDTFQVRLRETTSGEIAKIAKRHGVNLRYVDDRTIGISLDETTSESDLDCLLQIFNGDKAPAFGAREIGEEVSLEISEPFARTSPFLTESVFNQYHSETEMLRYIRRLESRDLSLTTSMIPLGSCTMKLNAAAEMFPVTWPEFNRLHPFAPLDQAEGYLELFKQLESWLAELTGLEAVSLQPNAGSQGEYAGLLAIHAYHQDRGEGHRNVCLIPTSAHGTNPASAVMAGLKVVAVACDEDGNIDLNDLRQKAETYRENLAALMVTYPSTHGVFEETIQSICQIVHDSGGQVFMDGANMNAQVGLCRPGDMGADVCHLNLHKTFCIPHGGGGPGMGPICVAKHLAPFRPTHPHVDRDGFRPIGPIAASPWSSASILVISWAYIRMMGAAGLTQASKVAILNANYVAKRVEKAFPVLYKGKNGLVAHECILDLRHFKVVTVEDVAKRLMDYGFHAPTISWPVPSTMMVEPTESESKPELDRFCEAMVEIHKEVQAVESGQVDPKDNLLKNAPHTVEAVASDSWEHPYNREQAAFPVSWLRHDKFWSPVGRIDNVYGDRFPVCTCVGMEAYTP